MYTKPTKKPSRLEPLLWLLAVIAAAGVALALLRVGPAPEIAIEPALPGIGPRTPITVRASAPGRGLGRLEVRAEQGGRDVLLADDDDEPRPFWAFWGPRTQQREIVVEVGSETWPELAAGELTLRVVAARASTPLRHPAPAEVTQVLPVRLEPPSLRLESSQIYLAQGGSAVVVYEVGAGAAKSGVEVGEDLFFPGVPLPGAEAGRRFAFFAAPYDLEDPAEVRLVVADELGNRAARAFLDRYLRRELPHDDIRLSDDFMARVVPAILEHTPEIEPRATTLETYLVINRDLRRVNAAALRELAAGARQELLWRVPFLQLPGAQAMAGFADDRTYLYAGEEVDRQVHLGFDLASVRHAPVPATNHGVVVLARYFGIYGKTVVVDHGFGLMSLYSHLSEIHVGVGDPVRRGDVLGRTGETGLAGGDHLHFSMLLGGVMVDPLEWWDGKWIRDRVAAKLGPALPLEETPAD